MTVVRTTCPYCGVGCGVLARPDGTIAGDPDHPANAGRLCVKGAALGDTLNDAERLTTPLLHGKPVTWEVATDLIAHEFAAAIAAAGPDSVGLYVSGQCLTEDYYVANKLMKGFVGTANIDTNSRLCMASSVAGHLRAFGEDVVPGVYEDFEQADLVVLVGSHAAWCHPVLFQRMRARRDAKLVVIDPRRTETAEAADLHLALRPGSDVLLFNGLLAFLAESGAIAEDWVARHVAGLGAAVAAARAEAGIDQVAAGTDLDPADIRRFYTLFAKTERSVTAFSQGVNQSIAGTDKVNAIINCHLATGRIGRAGMGPFSLTGQPNAMGGREVGGLATQLAAHLRLDEPADRDRLRRFWNAARIAERPGLKATEMFAAAGDGRLRALWIIGTNPAASLPDIGAVRTALGRCEFVVVSDCWPTETTACADLVLPAAGWGEKDGTVTNSERVISRQRRFRAAPGVARPDWWALAQVAQRMGFAPEFGWPGVAAIFREHAALSGFENDGTRIFDLGALAGLPDAAYDALSPTRWPVAGPARLFGAGGFPTPDGRARCVPVRWRAPARAADATFPFVLNTGRVRDQWHTMTRTGRIGRLLTHIDAPTLALAPDDAARLRIAPGDLLRITTPTGSAVVTGSVSMAQRSGEVFLPIHWTDAHVSAGPVGRLIATALDPISGQPELKATPAQVERLPILWRAILLSRTPVVPEGPLYWSRVPVAGGHALTLAGWEAPASAAALVGAGAGDQRIEVEDSGRGMFRLALLREGALQAAVFMAAGGTPLPDRAALAALFAGEDAQALLAGRGAVAQPGGAIVCSCFAVGLITLQQAVARGGLASVAAIGAALRAGTHCGTCVPELERILRDAPTLAA